ncbi:MAG: DUF4920 domain-containing protein [Pseudomonadota bacterium]
MYRLLITFPLALAALLLASPLTRADALRLSEPVTEDAKTETFGARLDESLPTMSLAELIAAAEEKLDQPVLVETRVGRVCQKKGCFFLATEGDLAVRVSFKDYGFFVPTDSSNKTVTLAGRLVQREVSAEQAAHFNSDLKGASVAAGVVYEIVADGVRIPKSS